MTTPEGEEPDSVNVEIRTGWNGSSVIALNGQVVGDVDGEPLNIAIKDAHRFRNSLGAERVVLRDVSKLN